MRIQSELHIGNHPDRDSAGAYNFTNGEPHAMGLIKIPLKDVSQHPRLQQVYDALPPDAQQFVQREGNLALSHDFTFNEDYKAGIGLTVENVNLDVSRLKDADKQQIGSWIQEQYGVAARNDAELAQASRDLNNHISTDMTFAGMSPQAMTDMLTERTTKPAGERDYGFIPPEQVDKAFASLQSRLGLSDTPDLSPGSADMQKITAYHDNVKIMVNRWPNPSSEIYGGETPDEGKVIFFKGFEAAGGEYIKAGPYAYSAAWPGNAEYDKNGVARSEDGKPVSYKGIESDPDYVYPPNGVLAKSYEGQKAAEIIDNFFSSSVTTYDGFDKNCAGISGRAVFGADFDAIPDRGKKNDLLWDRSHMENMSQNSTLPEGMGFHKVEVSGVDMTLDQNALHAATQEVSRQQAGAQAQNIQQQQAPSAERKPHSLAGLGAETIGKSLAGMGVALRNGQTSIANTPQQQRQRETGIS